MFDLIIKDSSIVELTSQKNTMPCVWKTNGGQLRKIEIQETEADVPIFTPLIFFIWVSAQLSKRKNNQLFTHIIKIMLNMFLNGHMI